MRPDDLAATAVKGLLERHPDVDPASIEEVYFGDANGAGEDNRNVARMAVLLAGLPVSIPGATVNRLCGSGLEAVSDASRAVAVGEADLIIAGGVESMTRAPWVLQKPSRAFPTTHEQAVELRARLADGEPEDAIGVDGGARRGRRDPGRRVLDHAGGTGPVRARVARARREGVGRRARSTPNRSRSQAWSLARDECIREDTTLEKLATLKPAFREGGTVTPGQLVADE